MLRAVLMTSSLSLGSYLMRSQCRYLRQVVCLQKKNTTTRNQSILVDEPIVDHHRITSIQVTTSFVLVNFSFICLRHPKENINTYPGTSPVTVRPTPNILERLLMSLVSCSEIAIS
ncbi:hypothetical protein EDB19DRAFT_105071 [Suillus lakei]|nr:hypothetical protein EDB19DRAFT_105071 [Suillus lakei]